MGILTALKVKNAKAGDKLADGDGLRLDVDKSGNASWVFRFKSPVTGKERFMGLGPIRDVGLAEAREATGAARALVRNNVDPIEHRISQRAKARAEATGSITFEAYAKQYIAGKEAGWKNEKHRQQWSNSLRDYAYPIMGQVAVPDVDTEAVLKVLRPVWNVKKESAQRVRGRIEAILNAAKAEGSEPVRTRRFGAVTLTRCLLGAANRTSSTIPRCPMKRCRSSGNRWPPTRVARRACCDGSY
jgi:hypothetical protein